MGVPAFFKWLTLRYPNIVIDANENIPNLNGLDLNKIIASNYIDSSLPSIDNLYFDMNGIIHPCAHPQDRDSPESFTEMFNGIFDYVDKIIRIIKPKKLIYMAIDGCAPRAKMNQQRSRRFRAALEAQERKEFSEQIEKEWKKKNLYNFQKNKNKFEFDSNCITPGTEFLHECGKAIHQYIKSRINNNELWKNLTVIFSDSSVPGEGEHKILDFIRSQRTFKEYNPNTSHCIYGADADLIMLSLIMHEPNFFILRETLNEKFYLICGKCGKHGHISAECEFKEKKFDRENASLIEIYENNKEKINEIDFCLIKIKMVRAYIKLEFEELIMKFSLDLERIIDDFVFICFLVGNDFLPNLPSLKIREGAIDALIYLYKKIRPEMKDYFTNGKGQLNLENCEILFKKLSLVEDEFFKQENINKINDENYRKNNNVNNCNVNKNILDIFESIGNENTKNNNSNNNKNSTNKDEIDLIEITDDILNIESKKEFKDFSIDELKKNGKNTFNQIVSEKIKINNNAKIKNYKDPIKLGENGWKDRYYYDKFHMKPDNKDLSKLKQKIKQFYIEGLCWVFEYYYNGCVSWEWYYPFHYAPFASDLTDIKNLNIKFNYGAPFNSFEQLLSVLPPFSSKALPVCLRNYMFDPLSPIADFYPQKIKLDINNQPFVWMGVNLIPFIDENRIKKVVQNNLKLNNFSKKELELNQVGNNLLICNEENFSDYVQGDFEIDENKNSFNKNINYDKIKEFKGLFLENVKNDKSKCFIFVKKFNGIKHKSVLNKGIIENNKEILSNLEFCPKTKFKGKQAIDIVKKVLGYEDANEVIERVNREIYDEKFNNNNRGIQFNPQDLHVLKKKRYQERMKDMGVYNFDNNNNKKRKINDDDNNNNNNNNNNNININNNNNNNNNYQNQLEKIFTYTNFIKDKKINEIFSNNNNNQ